jgi:hypothetical protein
MTQKNPKKMTMYLLGLKSFGYEKNRVFLKKYRDNATVTQLAEYLFCKQIVVGSSPSSGSID